MTLVVGGRFAGAAGRGWRRSTARPVACESDILLLTDQAAVCSRVIVSSFTIIENTFCQAIGDEEGMTEDRNPGSTWR